MEKLKLVCVALAATFMIYSCDTKRQEGGNQGSGESQGMNDALTEDNVDAVERAEEVNDEKFEADSAEAQSDFIVEAAEGGMYEVQVAKIAEQKATNEKVKKFAKHMVKEHSKANEELKALAKKKNVTIPTALGEDKQEKLQKLSGLTGAEFDQEYMDLMVEDHKKDVNLFDKASKGSNDNEVEKWAAEKLPVLQKHLEMAKQTQEEIEKTNTNTARK